MDKTHVVYLTSHRSRDRKKQKYLKGKIAYLNLRGRVIISLIYLQPRKLVSPLEAWSYGKTSL